MNHVCNVLAGDSCALGFKTGVNGSVAAYPRLSHSPFSLLDLVFGKGSLLRNEPQYPTKGYAPHSGRGGNRDFGLRLHIVKLVRYADTVKCAPLNSCLTLCTRPYKRHTPPPPAPHSHMILSPTPPTCPGSPRPRSVVPRPARPSPPLPMSPAHQFSRTTRRCCQMPAHAAAGGTAGATAMLSKAPIPPR